MEGTKVKGLAALVPADIGKIIGASRAAVYRYLSIGTSDVR